MVWLKIKKYICTKEFLGSYSVWGVFDKNIKFSRNSSHFTYSQKLQFCYDIWKEINKPLLPYRFCGRNTFSFLENLLSILAICEPCKIPTDNSNNWTWTWQLADSLGWHIFVTRIAFLTQQVTRQFNNKIRTFVGPPIIHFFSYLCVCGGGGVGVCVYWEHESWVIKICSTNVGYLYVTNHTFILTEGIVQQCSDSLCSAFKILFPLVMCTRWRTYTCIARKKGKYSAHIRVFSLNFWWGGDSKFSVPVGPRRGRSRMGGGTCEKNPTEAKTAHLVQN